MKFPFVIAAALALAGCPSASDQYCTTENKCGDLVGESTAQCQSKFDACVNKNNSASTVCKQYSDAWNTYASCGATAVCNDLEPQNLSIGACANQWNDFVNAFFDPGNSSCPCQIPAEGTVTNADGGM